MMPLTCDLPIRLPGNEVHLWYGDPTDLAADAVMLACRRMLSPAELACCNRFVHERDRQLYLAAHALLRRVLSHYAAQEPAAWQFSVGRHGKPELAANSWPDILKFNLSHTPGLVACAICRGCEVGIDVESVERMVEISALAKRFFSPSEAAELANFPAEGRLQRFYQYWTLKEAYIKAKGTGMSIPLDSFSMHLAADDQAPENPGSHTPMPTATIQFAEHVSNAGVTPPVGDHWQFAQYLPTAQHVMALAIQCETKPAHQIILHRATQAFVAGE